MSDPDLRALRGKYERMLRLRELHARARADTTFIEPDPRAAMAQLARDFPGALREIDELPLDDIQRRIAAIAAAELDASRALPWMAAQLAFHRLARGALAVKRWLADRDAELPLEASLWAGAHDAIATPPGGRVMALVLTRVALELNVSETEVRALLRGR